MRLSASFGQKRTYGLAVLCAGGALLAVFFHLLAPDDPLVDGQRLSEWLRVYLPASNAGVTSPRRRAADSALRSLGERALPILLRELQVEDTRAVVWSQMLLRRAKLIAAPRTSSADRNVAASRAFLALGPAASNAVPALIGICEGNRSIDSRTAALYALAWIGPSAAAAAPVLRRQSASANPRVRAGAVCAMGEIRAEPSLAIPLLIDALNSSSEWVQTCAARALGNFGALAAPAIPALAALTTRPPAVSCDTGRTAEARVEALNAIRKIETSEQEHADPLSTFSFSLP